MRCLHQFASFCASVRSRFAIRASVNAVVLLAGLCGAATLCGCASGEAMTVQVTALHHLVRPEKSSERQQMFAGKTVALVRPEGEADTLETRQYAECLTGWLVNYGFTAVPAGQPSDYTATYSYGISDERDQVEHVPVYGYAGGGVQTRVRKVYEHGEVRTYREKIYVEPTYQQIGTNIVQYRVYDRFFKLTLKNAQEASPEFEATAVNTGKSKILITAVPMLIKGMFKKFPGPCGTPYSVTVYGDS